MVHTLATRRQLCNNQCQQVGLVMAGFRGGSAGQVARSKSIKTRQLFESLGHVVHRQPAAVVGVPTSDCFIFTTSARRRAPSLFAADHIASISAQNFRAQKNHCKMGRLWTNPNWRPHDPVKPEEFV